MSSDGCFGFKQHVPMVLDISVEYTAVLILRMLMGKQRG